MATRRTIRPITPAADTPSILTVAAAGTALDEAFADDQVGWLDGVQFFDVARLPTAGRPFTNCDWEDQVVPAGGVDPAPPDEPWPTELPAATFPDVAKFYPWEVHAVIGCDTLTPSVDYTALARQAATAALARAISREVWTGYYSAGHALTRDAVELTGGTAVPLVEAMGLIQEAVAGPGTWHVPAVLEPALLDHGLVRPNGLVPLGPGSWPVSFGPAYPRDYPLQVAPWRQDVAQPPHEVGGGPAANAGTALAAGDTFVIGHYGRIEIAWRELDVQAPGQGVDGLTVHDLHMNSAEAVARYAAIYRYDPSLVFAARVTATT